MINSGKPRKGFMMKGRLKTVSDGLLMIFWLDFVLL